MRGGKLTGVAEHVRRALGQACVDAEVVRSEAIDGRSTRQRLILTRARARKSASGTCRASRRRCVSV